VDRGRWLEDRRCESALRLGQVDDVAARVEGATRGIATQIAPGLRQRERPARLAHLDALEAEQVDHLAGACGIAARRDHDATERTARRLGEGGLVEGTIVLQPQGAIVSKCLES